MLRWLAGRDGVEGRTSNSDSCGVRRMRSQTGSTMNAYGARAQDHWRRWLPTRYSQIQEPETFFADLGDEIQTRVEELTRGLAGEDRPGESYLEKLGRLNMAKLAAEEQALRELALLDPETSEDADEESTPS